MLSFNQAFAEALKPPPVLSLADWAEEFAFLSAESASAFGKWRAYPYQRGLLEALTDPENETVTIQKSTRVGYTKCINHALAYHIHYDPCPQMVVQPTVEDAEGYSKEEVAPMLRDTPVLAGLVADPKTRNSSNTILRKVYPGGFLVLSGANSARGFRRLTLRCIYFDEVDAYPASAGNEGDQIKLGTRRTETYWNRLIAIGGTPTIKHFSRVERHYLQSDQRRYEIPCLTCGTYQVLQWKHFHFPEKNPDNSHFKCVRCNKPIEEKDKTQFIERGRWTAEKEFAGHAGFHIWAAYSFSAKTTWKAIAAEFLEAKDNPDLLRVWVNTVLGETWEEKGDGIEASSLKKRQEPSKAYLDERALVLTCGVDIQKNRIELEVVAWAKGFEAFPVLYKVIPGDPHFKETWDQLDATLQRRFKREDGLIMRIHTTFIDSGYATQEVYKYTYPRQSRQVFATKGKSTPGNQMIAISKQKFKRGLKLYIIGTETAKDKVFSHLEINTPGPGYWHMPDHYPEDWFEGLTAEQKFTKMTKGVAVRYYRKVRTRNEPLDCRVLALAACEKVSPVWTVLERNLSRRAAGDVDNLKGPAEKKKSDKPPNKAAKLRRRVKRPSRRGFIYDY